jgi:hypothetical protein
MQDVTLIGIDLGKPSFHVHGQDPQGKALLRKKFSRKQLIEFLATFHACTGQQARANGLGDRGTHPEFKQPEAVMVA